MGPIGHEKAEPAAQEDGGDAGDVGQMGPAPVGVVEDDQVALLKGHGPERRLDGEGHGAQVDGDVRALGQRLAGAVEAGAGKVLPLLDVGGEGGAAEDGGHFFGDGDEDVLKKLQLDGVNFLHRRPSLRIMRFKNPSTCAA